MIDLVAAAECRADATDLRKRGDAFKRRADAEYSAGNEPTAAELETRAMAYFEDALAKLEAALEALHVNPPRDEPPSEPPSPPGADDPGWAADAAETLGSRGGVLGRLGRDDEALASYQTGALIERAHHLATTYCRGNVVRLSLQRGAHLAGLRHEIEQLKDTLAAQMTSPSSDQAPDAWAYADLGDYHLMLNDVSSAQSTYANFVRLADTGSPDKTWRALNDTITSMTEAGDPSANTFAAAVEAVRPVLKPDASTP